MELIKQNLDRKFCFSVPGLEEYSLGSVKEVMTTIDNISLCKKQKISEGMIEGWYNDHKRRAINDPHFNYRLAQIQSIQRKDPSKIEHSHYINRFLNYVIRKWYFAYIYIDFPGYGLSIDHIASTVAIHAELLDICKKVVRIYNRRDFSHVVLPLDSYKEKLKDELKAISEELQIIYDDPMPNIRKKYFTRSLRDQKELILQNYIPNPNYKPVHYMKLALSDYHRMYNMSISGFRAIITYHLRNQYRAKKYHNQHYRSVAAENRKSLPSENVKKIGNWIISNTGIRNKSKCSRELNISRSTVSRNWGIAMNYVSQIDKKTDIIAL